MRRRGWVRDVVQVKAETGRLRRASGELTGPGRDAYIANLYRDARPLTPKAIAGLRATAELSRDRRDAQEILSPVVFGTLRRRRLIAWAQDIQCHVLTRAGREALDAAEGAGS
jgi:hypothetical protein